MNRLSIHWFPGHMKKALISFKERLKALDLVIELADARAPESSRDKELAELIQKKDHLLVLTKDDAADPKLTEAWLRHLKSKEANVLAVSLHSEKDIKRLIQAARQSVTKKRAREKKLGLLPRPIRAIVVGIPNVGKSTLINRFAGRKAAPVADLPGFTRGERWIKAAGDLELLDTPGVLPSSYEEGDQAVTIALLGSIRDAILPHELLAERLIVFLKEHYPGVLTARYELKSEKELTPSMILLAIALKRGLLRGGIGDPAQAAKALLLDLRKGRLGRITFETPVSEE